MVGVSETDLELCDKMGVGVYSNKESLLFVLMYVLDSTGLSLHLARLLYPSLISRGCREGTFDERGVVPCFVSVVYLKWFGNPISIQTLSLGN